MISDGRPFLQVLVQNEDSSVSSFSTHMAIATKAPTGFLYLFAWSGEQDQGCCGAPLYPERKQISWMVSPVIICFHSCLTHKPKGLASLKTKTKHRL